MATIRAYTTIEQSRKLSEILPLESADMYYILMPDGVYNHFPLTGRKTELAENTDILCWSLAALLDVLPYPSLHKTFAGWRCDSYDKEGKTCKLGENADNPIDACYEMTLKLNELNLL